MGNMENGICRTSQKCCLYGVYNRQYDACSVHIECALFYNDGSEDDGVLYAYYFSSKFLFYIMYIEGKREPRKPLMRLAHPGL